MCDGRGGGMMNGVVWIMVIEDNLGDFLFIEKVFECVKILNEFEHCDDGEGVFVWLWEGVEM